MVSSIPSVPLSPAAVAKRPALLASPAVVLFLALFASQAGVLVMSPILARVAADFGVSIAAAGQLRILAAPFAAGVALLTGRALARYSPRALIGAGSALLAVGSLASAAAPTFVLLALAQVPMWGGIAMLLAAGVAATGAWSTPEDRSRLVSRALAGAPSAWIVGMPVIGLVSSIDWRLAFLVLPLPAALLAGLAAARRPVDTPIAGSKTSLTALLRIPLARRWALGELAANSAWAGTLVYSGVLFTETYGTSSAATGVALAIVAAAFLAGNQWAGRTNPALARQWMLRGSLAASVAVALTWAYTRSVSVTLVLFALTATVTAVRMVSGTVYGFAVAGELRSAVGTVRGVTTQFGYLFGSLAGGMAIALGGIGALAAVYSILFLAATLPYLCLRGPCPRRSAIVEA
jgi:MFS transporter, DHA1 family, inner membrane transport protein